MEPDIICEGYLTKAPPLDQPRSRWCRRYFTLSSSDKALKYYKDEENLHKVKGEISLSRVNKINASSQHAADNNHEHGFELETSKRLWVLTADSEVEMKKWLSCISNFLGESKRSTIVGSPSESPKRRKSMLQKMGVAGSRAITKRDKKNRWEPINEVSSSSSHLQHSDNSYFSHEDKGDDVSISQFEEEEDDAVSLQSKSISSHMSSSDSALGSDRSGSSSRVRLTDNLPPAETLIDEVRQREWILNMNQKNNSDTNVCILGPEDKSLPSREFMIRSQLKSPTLKRDVDGVYMFDIEGEKAPSEITADRIYDFPTVVKRDGSTDTEVKKSVRQVETVTKQLSVDEDIYDIPSNVIKSLQDNCIYDSLDGAQHPPVSLFVQERVDISYPESFDGIYDVPATRPTVIEDDNITYGEVDESIDDIYDVPTARPTVIEDDNISHGEVDELIDEIYDVPTARLTVMEDDIISHEEVDEPYEDIYDVPISRLHVLIPADDALIEADGCQTPEIYDTPQIFDTEIYDTPPPRPGGAYSHISYTDDVNNPSLGASPSGVQIPLNCSSSAVSSAYESLVMMRQDDDIDDIPEGMELVYNSPPTRPLPQIIFPPPDSPHSPPAEIPYRLNISPLPNRRSPSPKEKVPGPSRSPPKPLIAPPPSRPVLPPRTDKPADKPPVPSRGATLPRPPSRQLPADQVTQLARAPSDTSSSRPVSDTPPNRPVPDFTSRPMRPVPDVTSPRPNRPPPSLPSDSVRTITLDVKLPRETLESRQFMSLDRRMISKPDNNDYVDLSQESMFRVDIVRDTPPISPRTGAQLNPASQSHSSWSVSAGLGLATIGAAVGAPGHVPPRLPKRSETMAGKQSTTNPFLDGFVAPRDTGAFGSMTLPAKPGRLTLSRQAQDEFDAIPDSPTSDSPTQQRTSNNLSTANHLAASNHLPTNKITISTSGNSKYPTIKNTEIGMVKVAQGYQNVTEVKGALKSQGSAVKGERHGKLTRREVQVAVRHTSMANTEEKLRAERYEPMLSHQDRQASYNNSQLQQPLPPHPLPQHPLPPRSLNVSDGSQTLQTASSVAQSPVYIDTSGVNASPVFVESRKIQDDISGISRTPEFIRMGQIDQSVMGMLPTPATYVPMQSDGQSEYLPMFGEEYLDMESLGIEDKFSKLNFSND